MEDKEQYPKIGSIGKPFTGNELSEETLIWYQLSKEFKDWNRKWDLHEKGKMIPCKTEAQFIKELKSKYYLRLMNHGK